MSGIFAESAEEPGSISSITLPTGSTMSHQPPGGEPVAPTGAGNRGTGSHLLPQPVRSRNGTRVLPPPVRLSTSSRPIGATSPSFQRIASPPQPPPLPPPPPSPQLVPLKVRLARSRSVSSHPTSSPLGASDRANQQRWDVPTAASRRAAFGQNQSRSLKESLYDGSGGDELPSSNFLSESAKTAEKIEPVPFSSPSVFLPIVHPRERNIITVCLASFIFLSVSVLITGVFSAVVLPLCLLACLIRRIGIWSANLYQPVVCCRCNRPQLRVSSMNPFVLFFARLLHQMNDPEHLCQCFLRGSDNHYTLQSLRPLTPAELRWLPAYECKSVTPDPSFGPSLCSRHSAPLIMICLRFGAPGIELVKLREVIGARLLKGYSAPSSLASSPRESSLGDGRGIGQRQRSYPFVPPADTLSRLTQCLTCLSTGYAWRECLAFRLEDHVIHVPAACLPKSEICNLSKPYRPSPSSHLCGTGNSGQQAPTIKVDSLVESLSELPLLPNRPLWQAYLLEQYQEFDESEPSDADSAAETDEPGHPKGRWSGLTVNTGRGHLFTSKRFKPDGSPASELRPASSSSSFVCRRSGSAGIGSLLIFRLHAVLSDDGKALVHLLTNCLTDLPSRAHSPSRSSSTFRCRNDDSRDVSGQSSHRRWRGHNSEGGTNQLQQSSLPAGNSVQSYNKNIMQDEVPAEGTGGSGAAQVPNDSRLLQHNPEITTGTIAAPRITVRASPTTNNSLCDQSLIQSEDEDPEEKEAAQWWFTFWSSSLATIATFCDLVRAILTGPAVILHKYFFTRADMGILVKHKGSNTNTPPSSLATSDSSSHAQRTEKAHNAVYKCMLLSLVKLSRVRQVTKASYSEIILSLLAGALRAYHQSVGLQHPPDLLAFLSVEVPVLPGCPIIQTEHESMQQTPVQTSGAPSTTTPWPTHRVPRLWTPAKCRRQPEGLAEAGLIGNNNRTVAIAPLRSTTNSLCPGRHVLADICLPINTEGMLPRLWETRQRLIELNNSVDPLCLAWARTILYTLMPHPVAAWLEENHGSSAKASVSVTGVDVVSPFSRLVCNSKDQDRGQTYQMPPTRRLAYMSILASKSAEARSLRRRLRKSLPRGASVYPPRLGTSFRALARHLTNANAGLVYVAGSPVVRIDTWMPSPRLSCAPSSPEIIIQPTGSEISLVKWSVCRDLSVAFTTYAGQLSLTFSGTMASDCYPNLDLVLHAIKIQLRNMCHLLAGRHVSATTDRWLHCGSQLEARNTATAAVNLSPSLNPNLVLRQESDSTSVATRSAKPPRPMAPARGAAKRRHTPHSYPHSPGKLPSSTLKGLILEGTNRCLTRASPTERPGIKSNPNCPFQSGGMGISDNLSSQSTEQLQDRLRAVQQLLSDSAIATNAPRHCITEDELASLRAEFSTIIRELKQRCNTTGTVLPQTFDPLLRDSPCQKGTSQHHPDGNSMSQHPMDTINASIYNRIPRRSTEFIMPLVKLTHAKVTNSENTTPQRAQCSFSGGDFDEDPDFYIDGSDEEDDFDDEMVDDETSNPVVPNTLAPPSTSSASVTATRRVFGFKYNLNSALHPHHNKPTRQKDYRSRQKHRHGSRSNVNRRRSSLLSTDIGSLDITPNRRGSLGGTTKVPATGRILYKFARPKRANTLSQTPEPVSWTKA